MADGQVYLVGVLEGCYKIGRSGDSEKRLRSYSPKLPVTLSIHHRITTDDDVWLESLLHAAFAHRRSMGEWFRLTPADLGRFCDLVALRRGDAIPEWISELVGKHFTGGVESLASTHDAIRAASPAAEKVQSVPPPRIEPPQPTSRKVKPTDVVPSSMPLMGCVGDISADYNPPQMMDFSWVNDEDYYIVRLVRPLAHDPIRYHPGCYFICRKRGELEEGDMVSVLVGPKDAESYAFMTASQDENGFWYLLPLHLDDRMPRLCVGKEPHLGREGYFSLVSYGVVEMYIGNPVEYAWRNRKGPFADKG